MTHLAASPCLAGPHAVLSADHLASLARTYERVSSPVWVYDRSARCVYRNHSARRLLREGSARLTFDIVDHAGHIVGQLATVEA